MDQYVRNYVVKSDLVPGTPIRTTELDASGDAVVVALKPGVLILQRPDESQFPVRWEDGVYPHRFPRRNGPPVQHKFPVPVEQLMVNDRVSYISEHATVQSIYRRPDADWARITIVDTFRRKRITKVVDLERELTRNYLFNIGEKRASASVEKAGPYRHINGGYVWFMVHPTGRGRYPIVPQLDVLKPPKALSYEWSEVYGFAGKHPTHRHPNDSQSKTGSDWV